MSNLKEAIKTVFKANATASDATLTDIERRLSNLQIQVDGILDNKMAVQTDGPGTRTVPIFVPAPGYE